MAFFLTGGGDQDDFRELDKVFLESLPNQASILVIPLAADQDDFEDILERVESCFSGKKINAVELCEDPSSLSTSDLENYDALFIEGGNTFQLVEAMRGTKLFDGLEEYLSRGRSIYADSAGAIVLGSNVRSAFLGDEADEDAQKLQDYRGLNLLDPWSIHCHYESSDDEGLQNLLFESGSPILVLAEPCGVHIEGRKLRVYGKESLEVFTFTGKQVYGVGEEVDLENILG